MHAMTRGVTWLALAAALMGCGRPATPPDPPLPVRAESEDDLYPSVVRELEIDHTGCFGTCPVYRVRVTNTGEVEYEGKKFVHKVGRVTASLYPVDVAPLFEWLRHHPALYGASTNHRHGEDTEEITYRFHLKNGQSVVVESDVGFSSDDLWVLSHIVDGMIGRALMRANGEESPNEPKPAT
jgi:hypothetical protein